MENSQITHQILSVSHSTFVKEFMKALLISLNDHLDVSFIGCHCANLHVTSMTSISELRIICSCTCFSFVFLQQGR